jgi:hypothetical protein
MTERFGEEKFIRKEDIYWPAEYLHVSLYHKVSVDKMPYQIHQWSGFSVAVPVI